VTTLQLSISARSLSPSASRHCPSSSLCCRPREAVHQPFISFNSGTLYHRALEDFISRATHLYSLSVFTCAPPSLTVASVDTVTHGDVSTNGTNYIREAFRAIPALLFLWWRTSSLAHGLIRKTLFLLFVPFHTFSHFFAKK